MKRGFKGMSKDMLCRGFEFKLGHTYQIQNKKLVDLGEGVLIDNYEPENNPDLRLCSEEVIHYCDKLKDVFYYYSAPDTSDNRFFVVQVLGDYVNSSDKSGTTTIYIESEISSEDIKAYKTEEKRKQIDARLGLDLVYDLQQKYPQLIIGGSLGLYLRGYTLSRLLEDPDNADFDFVSPYYLGELDGMEEGEDRSSGSDFDTTYKIKVGSVSKKVDVKVDPYEKFEIVTYRGRQFKVGDLFSTLEAKIKYSKQSSGKKHKTDILELLSKEREKVSDSSKFNW